MLSKKATNKDFSSLYTNGSKSSINTKFSFDNLSLTLFKIVVFPEPQAPFKGITNFESLLQFIIVLVI